MSGRVVDVPEAVCQKAKARGSEGRWWLDRLGCLIGEMERDWGWSSGLPSAGDLSLA